MSNTVNSISILQKECTSKEKTDKDPVIQLPPSSEIEFIACPRCNNLDSFNTGFETNRDPDIQSLQSSEIEFKTGSEFNNLDRFNTGFETTDDPIIQLPQSSEIEVTICPGFDTGFETTDAPVIESPQNFETECITCPEFDNLDNFNTGFSKNNDLHYQTPCKKPELKTPLYQENYFSEFKTEEEKAAARHALGLYDNTDVVLMTLLTAENGVPTQDVWEAAEIKQMQNGYEFFIPLTSFNAVYDSNGKTLDSRVRELQSIIQNNQKEINKINQASSGSTITSLKDVKLFLEGFNNGETLRETIDSMNQQMVRFEKTGLI